MRNDTIASPRRRADQASGRFVLRIDPGLHALLRKAAAEANLSLNEYCALKLAAPAGQLAQFPDGAQAVLRAAAEYGEKLVAAIVYGSWARGEADAASDVDLLLVLDNRLALTRELYRRWDLHPMVWEERPIEVHFVHLPDMEREVPGIWAEIALDGLILFERDFQLSKRLAQMRKKMFTGRIIRKTIHGQPYWTEVA
jgi:predicted nucleotidyltransferase